MVHAILITPLHSAHSRKVTQWKHSLPNRWLTPVIFSSQGSRLRGSVLQVRPAGKLNRNGQLRIAFHQVVPPVGIQQAVDASLAGVAVEKGEHLTLDSEGGAQVTTPKTRYLTTAISVALASSSMADHDRDAGIHGRTVEMLAKVQPMGRRDSASWAPYWSVFSLASRRLRIWILWSRHIGLLSFSCPGPRRGLSKRYVNDD